jgi:predicted ATPase with chaperone activity
MRADLSARVRFARRITISDAGLIGCGAIPRPGEVSLGHDGVFLLDELPEFERNVLEVMRQPLEDGAVAISRAATSITFPSRFMLAAAMNPCPAVFRRSDAPMPLLATANSALRLKIFRPANRPHRHSHRSTRGEIQGTARQRNH